MKCVICGGIWMHEVACLVSKADTLGAMVLALDVAKQEGDFPREQEVRIDMGRAWGRETALFDLNTYGNN